MAVFEMHRIADEIINAQDRADALIPITSRYPEFGLQNAYDVARIVHEARMAKGGKVVGRKIGFTNPKLWDKFGVREPIWGYAYQNTLIPAASGTVDFDLTSLLEPRIEPEIIVHFRDAPSPDATVAADILPCIDWIAHGCEIVQSRFPNWRFEAADTIADAALHAALIVGEPVPISRIGADPHAVLSGFSIEVFCDEKHRETGSGENVLGSPINAIIHLVDLLKARDAPPIEAGEIVTTGSLTEAYPIRPGEIWRTILHDISLPGLTISFR